MVADGAEFADRALAGPTLRGPSRTGGPGVGEAATGATRLPAGHPEGFLEAFALLYRNFADTLQARRAGKTPTEENLDFPTIADGVRGMAFIETVVASAEAGATWLDFRT